MHKVVVTERNSTLKILGDTVSIPFHSPEFKNKLSPTIKYILNKLFGWRELLEAMKQTWKSDSLCCLLSVWGSVCLTESWQGPSCWALWHTGHSRVRYLWLKGCFVDVMFLWNLLQVWCPVCVSVCRTRHCFHVSVQNPHGYSCSVLSLPLTLIFVPLLTLCH